MSYDILFRLELKHTYYADGICQGLTVRPAAANSVQMQSLDLLLRNQSGGIYLAGDADANGNLVHVPNHSFSLVFYLVPDDELFNNYTQLPYYSDEKICAFNNVDVRISGNQVLLHSATHVDSKNLVERIGLNAIVSFTGLEGEVEVYNAAGTKVAQLQLINGQSKFAAPDGKEGLYIFKQNGTELRRVCVCNPPMGTAVTGLVEIWFDPAVPTAAQYIGADGKISLRDFAIAFQAREAFWNYLIVSDTYLASMKNIAITDSSLSIFFQDDGKSTLFNGKKAYSYTSPEPFPFSQQPEKTFQLRKNCIRGISNGSVVVGKLPAANGAVVIPSADKNSLVAKTELIVYL